MENKTKTAPKDKRRNNEKRKEKSRDAARSRRSKETEVFTDLGNALPISQEQVSQLDKASVMRLAIAYLRVRDMITLVPEPPEPDDHKILTDDSIFLKALEGFLLVMSSEGDIVYMSENVSEYLGISQIDLMGQNIYEYSHPCDHEEIKEILSTKARKESEAPKSFFIRLKCTLTSKGRSVNLKSATYKVIHCTGHIVQTEDDGNEENPKGTLRRCLVAVGQPIPHPSNIEAPLPRQTFLTKHSLDMKFTHADDKIMMDVLGYDSEDLVGKSVYDYHHAMDSDAICSAFKCLFSKGQCETNRYRFLAKTGGYVWVLTQATLINDNKTMKPQSVVCVNYVISGVECKDEIYSSSQLASVKTENLCINENIPVLVEKVVPEATPVKKAELNNTKKVVSSYLEDNNTPKPPLTATSKIFAPRTKEMNKGFLMFSDEEPGLTMLKDEPDDLTHLAPVAGDVCVPLDDHPFLTDKMLDDFLLRDSFEPLLTDEPTDPFISYRDSYDNSPQLLSPNLSKNSECSLPSLNSPSDSLSDEDRLSTFMNLHTEDESDLVVKAPYITMNMGDDLPLLLSDDLMWSSSEKSRASPDSSSSLAQLLCSSINKHSRPNDHGGGLISPDRLMDVDEYYNKKNTAINGKSSSISSRLERTNKRSNTSNYESNTKRSRNEPKEKMSSELLQQLMSNNHHRGRPRGKSNWLLDSGGQKAACISQPSDSVLMNLLDDSMERTSVKRDKGRPPGPPHADTESRQNTIRKNSLSLLDPDATIPSLLDLTQQDFEVNAPVNNLLLQGTDLLTALDINGPI
ncbi:hypoxia-inducible factor 1-alpha isoform X3 [Tribolium madens]|uniref:hypoxia-inducible factor 1-alpha isoform X3 n=1 Tax=Tribolium madens TaxID=41895 RepID=UPI001CF753C6|nr:hypoxia-inducible factor 1-alpha isoform X3 [Tribolium madens]